MRFRQQESRQRFRKFPPVPAWRSEFVAALAAADQAVGRLAGEDLQLPNPHLLIRTFLRREAVLSSRIEAGIMQQVGGAKRERPFCATEILAILEEPTRLDADSG